MGERLTKIETQVDGLRRLLDMTLLAVLGVGAILVALAIYGLNRTDNLTDKIGALPGQINADLRDISKTLAESIMAAKQQPPQVILIPAPTVPDEPSRIGP